MDVNTTRDADAAEMAALYRAADDKGREFAAHMEKGMAVWAQLVEARKAVMPSRPPTRRSISSAATNERTDMSDQIKRTVSIDPESDYEIHQLKTLLGVKPVTKARELCYHYVDRVLRLGTTPETITIAGELRQAKAKVEMLTPPANPPASQ